MGHSTGDPDFPEFASFFQGTWADRTFSGDEPLDEFLARLESGLETSSLEIGPYRCIRELGRGGQGVVYLAEDPRLEREVALKILRCSPLDAHRLLARFQREARVASRLDHPGICHVFDAGVAEGVPYIAMRYIEGRSLATMLKGAASGGV